MAKPSSSLMINSLEVEVYLGWTSKERSKKQIVYFDLMMAFPQSPKACLTDNLDDTFCYKELIDTIRKNLTAKKFKLVEHLGHFTYQVLQSELPKRTRINVVITKYPDINGLSGGVSFQYGET